MELLAMENSTRIKAVLTAILAAALGGDEALTAAWDTFSAWAFANLQGTDLAEIGGFKIAAVAGLGLYLFWRRRTGSPYDAKEAAFRRFLLRELAARGEGGGTRPTAVIDPASPPGNPPTQGSGAMTPGKETET
jgi:hypothetical protein